ncbi:MAG: hypothetical protein K0B16_03650 [Burkholderiaceae bacterium]|nr:hypothetical protein [Burkholderiaceae bacterium]
MLKPGGWLTVMTMFQTEDAAFARWQYRRDPTQVVFYRETTFRVIARLHHWRCEIPCVNVALLSKPRLKSAPPQRNPAASGDRQLPNS